jgi:hypothetical protein
MFENDQMIRMFDEALKAERRRPSKEIARRLIKAGIIDKHGRGLDPRKSSR